MLMQKYCYHVWTRFCACTRPDSVFVLSVDDKAKLPIGITAATKQTPLVMHMTYEIRLPAHDFVVATSHKLTPTQWAQYFESTSVRRGYFVDVLKTKFQQFS